MHRDFMMTLDGSSVVASRPVGDWMPATPDTLAAVARDPQLAAQLDKVLRAAKVQPGPFQLSRDHRTVFMREGAIVDLASGRVRGRGGLLIASADGSRIAQNALDRVDLIEVRTDPGDKLVRRLSLDLSPIPAPVALSEDGKVLVTELETKLTVFDVDSGRTILEPPCHTSYDGDVVLSRDGKLLVCAETGGNVDIYDVRGGKLVKQVFVRETETVDTFALSDDGRHLAISSDYIAIVDL
jgi:WD40 repeat protein